MKELSPICLSILFTACLALCHQGSVPGHARTLEKKRVAVLQFVTVKTPRSHGSLVRNYTEMELQSAGNIQLLEREQVSTGEDMGEARKYGCNDSSCAILAGRSLTARYVIYGTVTGNSPYSISMRAVSVEDEKIIAEYSESFTGMEKTRNAVRSLSRRIVRDIMAHDSKKVPRVKKSTETSPVSTDADIDIRSHLILFQPLGRLQDLVRTGYGLQAGVHFSDITLFDKDLPAGLHIGFETGVVASRGRDNESDRFHMVPFMLSTGYLVPLPQRFYAMPRLFLGVVYLRFSHDVGHGFDMDDNSTRHAMDPSLGSGLILGYNAWKGLCAEMSFSHAMFLESSGPVHSLQFQAGITYRLGWSDRPLQ